MGHSEEWLKREYQRFYCQTNGNTLMEHLEGRSKRGLRQFLCQIVSKIANFYGHYGHTDNKNYRGSLSIVHEFRIK